jgi:hypothetical protein
MKVVERAGRTQRRWTDPVEKGVSWDGWVDPEGWTYPLDRSRVWMDPVGWTDPVGWMDPVGWTDPVGLAIAIKVAKVAFWVVAWVITGALVSYVGFVKGWASGSLV